MYFHAVCECASALKCARDSSIARADFNKKISFFLKRRVINVKCSFFEMNATELVLGLSSTPIPVTFFVNSEISSEVGFGDIMSSSVGTDFVTTTEAPDGSVRSWLTNLIMQVCIQRNC